MSEMHYFNVEVASKYGVNCAILLQNLWHWVQKNKANGQNCFEGRYWTYNSIRAFAQLFPYLSDRQIRCALKTLEDEGLIVTGNFNENRYDRTLWYSVTEKGEAIMNGEKATENEEDAPSETEKTALHFNKVHFTKKQNGNCENVEPIPNNKPYINPDRNQIENGTRAREDGFVEFWAQYPKKVDKQDTEKVWAKLKPDDDTFAAIMAGLAKAKTSRQWQTVDYIPSPRRWLNGRKWEDEIPTNTKPMTAAEQILADAAMNGERSEFLNAFFNG